MTTELIEGYREQLRAVANEIAARIMKDAPNEAINGLVGALLATHVQVIKYDRMIAGDDDGGNGEVH